MVYLYIKMVVDFIELESYSGIGLTSARLLSRLTDGRELSDVTVSRMEKLLNSIECGDRISKECKIGEGVVDVLRDWRIANAVLLSLGYHGEKRGEKAREYLSCIDSLKNNRELSEEQKLDLGGFLGKLRDYCTEEHRKLMS